MSPLFVCYCMEGCVVIIWKCISYGKDIQYKDLLKVAEMYSIQWGIGCVSGILF